MNKLVRSLYAGAALSMPLIFTITTPAVAAPEANAGVVAVIQGSGGIGPGLEIIPDEQSISFGGTATVVAAVESNTPKVLASYGCGFGGTDLAGWIGSGVGFVSGSCGPLSFETCVFVREAAHVDVVCANTSSGVGGAYAKCVFRPHQVLPVTSYDLTCIVPAAATATV